MSEKKNSFKFRFPEFLLIGLLLVSNVVLNFSGGGFILNLKKIGFSAISTVEKQIDCRNLALYELGNIEESINPDSIFRFIEKWNQFSL